MLELRGVTKRYSGIAVVSDISFTARAGEVTGYLGPNGSGKSTTLKMITGLVDPSGGEILYRGEPIDLDPIAHRQRLGYVPEEPELYPHLTGTEYLEMVGSCAACRTGRCRPKSTASSDCFYCMTTGTWPFRPIPRACGRRCCWPPQCCIILASC